MTNISSHNKKFLITLIIIILSTIFVSFFHRDTEDVERILRTQKENFIDAIDQRMTPLIFEINNFSKGTGADIYFLSSLSSIHNIAGETDGEIVSNYKLLKLEHDFSKFLIKNKVYGEVQYTSLSGDILLHASLGMSEGEISFKRDEESISYKDYFEKTIQLKEGEVYVSKIFLRKKEAETSKAGIVDQTESDLGEIIQGESNKDFLYNPAVIYSTPVIDENGNIKGVISSVVNIYYFFDDIRNFQRKGESIFLINSRGEYLSHPDQNKEFGFILKTGENFFKDYPKVPQEIILDSVKRQFETAKFIFTSRRIYSASINFVFYEDDEGIITDNKNGYFWVLISVSDKEHITKTEEITLENHIFFFLIIGILLLSVIFLVFILAYGLPRIGYSEVNRALMIIKNKNEKK